MVDPVLVSCACSTGDSSHPIARFSGVLVRRLARQPARLSGRCDLGRCDLVRRRNRRVFDGFPGQPSLPRPRVTYTATTPATALDNGWLCSPDMTHLTAMTAAHATDRLADWQTALRAENKSPGTVTLYADGATRYLRWCADRDHLPMSRA